MTTNNNSDLVWGLDSIQQRQRAIDFVMLFESRLCVYSPSVSQMYSNYSIVFPNPKQARMLVLPDPYAFHDTFNGITRECVRDTGLFILPGEFIKRNGLQMVQRIKGTSKVSNPIPLQRALEKILETQDSNDPFVPVLIKGDLREMNTRTPCLHLHRLKLPLMEGLSGFERLGIQKAVHLKLQNLYEEAENIRLTA